MSRESITFIAEILVSELSIEQDRVRIYNQSTPLPEDLQMYIILRYGLSKVMANNRKVVDGVEQLFYSAKQDIIMDIISAGDEARIRKEEAILAMNSTLSISLQESNAFRIGKIPTSFLDTSTLETTRPLNRYTITFPVFIQKKINKNIEFYSSIDNNNIRD